LYFQPNMANLPPHPRVQPRTIVVNSAASSRVSPPVHARNSPHPNWPVLTQPSWIVRSRVGRRMRMRRSGTKDVLWTLLPHSAETSRINRRMVGASLRNFQMSCEFPIVNHVINLTMLQRHQDLLSTPADCATAPHPRPRLLPFPDTSRLPHPLVKGLPFNSRIQAQA